MDDLDLTQFLRGPDLLLKNTFRLAQMPVDASERELNKRQQMIEMVKTMNMPVSDGPSAIFPIESLEDGESFKEAIHRIRDPIHRLFDELFWFWPGSFGKSIEDQGLALLIENRMDEVIKLWKDGERENENVVSSHNLAVLHQLIALEIEKKFLNADEPLQTTKSFLGITLETKDVKVAKKHWEESYSRWVRLVSQDKFWERIKDRIRSLNDRRLPVDFADWLRINLPSVLFSVNVGLIVRAAENGFDEHIVRHREFLQNSGFDHHAVEAVLDTFMQKHRNRIDHLCKTAENSASKAPLGAHVAARQLAEQAESTLRLLAKVYPHDDKRVAALHDDVALGILHCQILYGKKTEDWDTSEVLLKLADPIARSSTVSSRIKENIKQVEELKEAGGNWVEKGYYDLPGECVEFLDKARDMKDAGRYDDAIDLLRKPFLGLSSLPEDPEFLRHLYHGISYCFKNKSIALYNKGMDEYAKNVRKTLIGNLRCDGWVGQGRGMCASCMGPIYGQYVQRTIEGHSFPICISCNQKIQAEIKSHDAALSDVTQEALDLMVIAEFFDPKFKSVIKNMAVIRERANESGIQNSDLFDLRVKWNLVNDHEAIEVLIAGDHPYDSKLFKNLAKIISAQEDLPRKQTLSALFKAAGDSEKVCSKLIHLFYGHDYIFLEFIRHAFSNGVRSAGNDSSVFLDVVLKSEDCSLQIAVIEQIRIFGGDRNSMIEMIVSSLCNNVGRIVERSDINDLSFASGNLGKVLSQAARVSRDLDRQLIARVIVTGARTKKLATAVIEAIHRIEYARDQFYSMLDSNDSGLEQNGKRQYYEILVRHWDGEIRMKALKWNLIHESEKVTLVKMLIGALGDPEPGVRYFAHTRLLEYPYLSVQHLLEAVYTDSQIQLTEICLLLNELRSRVSKQNDELPTIDSLVSVCLTVNDQDIVKFTREAIDQWYPTWATHKSFFACVPWLKFAMKSSSSNAAHLSIEMLEQVKNQSFVRRFMVWMAREIPAKPNYVTEWWRVAMLKG
ncbi:MAG: hypothetical protein WAO55_08125 [Candidatus Manganitrophaceae bacterium]